MIKIKKIKNPKLIIKITKIKRNYPKKKKY
jgi:hypothetical protein